MEHSLRKGHFAINLGYENNCDDIGARDARTETVDGNVVLRVTLKPTGENDRLDQEYFQEHTGSLRYVQITEKQVLKELSRVLNRNRNCGVKIEIFSQGRPYQFEVKDGTWREDYFLQLNLK